jgi:hypothetical protein
MKSPSSTNELLVLVDASHGTDLNPTQREIVSALRSGLTLLFYQKVQMDYVNVQMEQGKPSCYISDG